MAISAQATNTLNQTAYDVPSFDQIGPVFATFLYQAERSGSELALLRIGFEFNGTMQDEPDQGVVEIIGNRIRGCIRSGDILSRSGDCEFSVLLTSDCPIVAVSQIAERLRQSVSKPVNWAGRTVTFSCSIGVTTTRDDLLEANRVFSNSGSALAKAQAKTSGGIQYFSSTTQKQIDRFITLSADLAAALDEGEIVPWFQPQIRLDTDELTGFEALVRWDHPTKGILSPVEFLDIAEQTGQIEKLGEVVLTGSLQALRQWESAGLHVPRIAVNLSTAQLTNPCLAERIKWELDRLDVEPERLTIEVLETVLGTGDGGVVARNLKALKSLGVRIDLDDFGTGSAAIVNIRRFGVHRIKIDRSFVQNIDQEPEQMKITSAMVIMARALGVEVLAEGVETEGERSVLQQLGCEFLQGYALAKPMPADKVPAWIRARRDLAHVV